jgi:hypothetical protein
VGWYSILESASHLGFEVFAAVTKKNSVFWDLAPCGFIINRRSEERVASIFGVKEITRARKSVKRLLTDWLQFSLPQLYQSVSEAEGLQFESRQGQEFPLPHSVQTGSGVHPASYPMGTAGLSPEVKWSWSAEVKKTWSRPLLPHTSTLRSA